MAVRFTIINGGVEQVSQGSSRKLASTLWGDRVREIQGALGEVNPMTVEEWEEAFLRADKPENELDYWLQVARVYRRSTLLGHRACTLQDRKRCLHSVVTGTT